MYIKVRLRLGYYSVGTVKLSFEDCTVDSAVVNPIAYMEGSGRLAFNSYISSAT